MKNLKEAYFNYLFVQLRINESTKKIKSLNLKFKGKKLDFKFKVFINIIIGDETNTRLDKIK